MPRIAVYAIGGNALSSPNGDDAVRSAEILAHVMSDVIDLLEAGWGVVLTHGNGPQVGHLMELDLEQAQTMDSWVSATQGMIGHSLALNLDSILHRRQRPERTACILTRVLVDGNDNGFQFPTKPVGPILSADAVMSSDWDIAETIKGPRRVVASPLPMKVIDLPVIQKLVELHAVVVCGGGGGFVGSPLALHIYRSFSSLWICLTALWMRGGKHWPRSARSCWGTGRLLQTSTRSRLRCSVSMPTFDKP